MVDKAPRKDGSIDYMNIKDPFALSNDELREALTIGVARAAFPSICDSFAAVAIDKLSKHAESVDMFEAKEDVRDTATDIKDAMLHYHAKAYTYSKAVEFTPESMGLKKIASNQFELFKYRTYNDFAKLLVQAFGNARAVRILPQEMKDVVYVEVSKQMGMPDMAELIRYAALVR